MNRIVREHYPVSQWPEDLRREVSGAEEVTLTIEVNANPALEPPHTSPVPAGRFPRYRDLARANFDSTEEVVAHVRALRDEWDERGRERDRIRNGS